MMNDDVQNKPCTYDMLPSSTKQMVFEVFQRITLMKESRVCPTVREFVNNGFRLSQTPLNDDDSRILKIIMHEITVLIISFCMVVKMIKDHELTMILEILPEHHHLFHIDILQWSRSSKMDCQRMNLAILGHQPNSQPMIVDQSEKVLQSNGGGGGSDLMCPRCKTDEFVHLQMEQVRGGDEGMTVFLKCGNCGRRWKHC